MPASMLHGHLQIFIFSCISVMVYICFIGEASHGYPEVSISNANQMQNLLTFTLTAFWMVTHFFFGRCPLFILAAKKI